MYVVGWGVGQRLSRGSNWGLLGDMAWGWCPSCGEAFSQLRAGGWGLCSQGSRSGRGRRGRDCAPSLRVESGVPVRDVFEERRGGGGGGLEPQNIVRQTWPKSMFFFCQFHCFPPQ